MVEVGKLYLLGHLLWRIVLRWIGETIELVADIWWAQDCP